MWRSFKSRLRRAAGIRRSEDGSLTVEMALVTPFFILLIIGGFEIANFQMLQGDVQHAVQEPQGTSVAVPCSRAPTMWSNQAASEPAGVISKLTPTR